MQYAYLDESGNTAPAHPAERFLVVAAVTGAQATFQAVRRHVERLRRRSSKPWPTELKAFHATPKQRVFLLERLAAEHVAVTAVILDKLSARQPPSDPEDWYRLAVVEAALSCAKKHRSLTLIIDKRYTRKSQRERLEEAIRGRLADVSTPVVSICQRDSRADQVLQAVDYVAWCIRRKYEKGEDQYYQIIRDRIDTEVVIRMK